MLVYAGPSAPARRNAASISTANASFTHAGPHKAASRLMPRRGCGRCHTEPRKLHLIFDPTSLDETATQLGAPLGVKHEALKGCGLEVVSEASLGEVGMAAEVNRPSRPSKQPVLERLARLYLRYPGELAQGIQVGRGPVPNPVVDIGNRREQRPCPGVSRKDGSLHR